jgi:hypothetical protein
VRNAEAQEKRTELNQKGQIWLEPYREWLNDSKIARGQASLINSMETKLFFEKIGSNLFLKDKKVRLDFRPPFSFVPKYKALDRELSFSSAKNKTGYEVDYTTYPVWLPELD